MQELNHPGRSAHVQRILALLFAGIWLVACGPSAPPQLGQATLLPSPKPITDFQLTDHHGQPFTLNRLKGHWTLAFFGYTHCPDVCPTSMAILAQVQKKLEQQIGADQLPQVVFFSVDPERDSVEQLSRFVPYFHPGFLGVTGAPQEIMKLTRQIGILYGREQGSSDQDYLIDHSAAIILFDPDGSFHALFNVPHDPALITADFLAIRHYYETKR